MSEIDGAMCAKGLDVVSLRVEAVGGMSIEAAAHGMRHLADLYGWRVKCLFSDTDFYLDPGEEPLVGVHRWRNGHMVRIVRGET